MHGVVICPQCSKLDTTTNDPEQPEHLSLIAQATLLVHEDHFRSHRFTTPGLVVFSPKQDWDWGKTTFEILDRDQPGAH